MVDFLAVQFEILFNSSSRHLSCSETAFFFRRPCSSNRKKMMKQIKEIQLLYTFGKNNDH